MIRLGLKSWTVVSCTGATREGIRRRLRCMFKVAVATAPIWGFASAVNAVPPLPQSADVTITAQASSPLGTLGVVPASPANVIDYNFTVNNGQSFSQTIPVQICSSNHQSLVGGVPNWTSYDIGPNHVSGNLAGSTTLSAVSPATFVPTTTNFRFTFAEGNPGSTCKTFEVQISTGPLNLTDPNVAQVFPVNVNNIARRASDPSTGSGVNLDITGTQDIHIKVNVVPVQNALLCYMTDSSGNFLLDANGEPVDDSGSSDGVFTLVVNKKNVEVATNPGQFYFNLVWWNQGSSNKTVYADMRTPHR